jgi:diadenosine tetraphosphate (Ap4A) HIT family hydrolase
MRVAAALNDLVQPSKMNYEIHGNTVPHLHMHLFPRFDGDPFQGQPIDGRNTDVERSPRDITRLSAALTTL